jgi:hypothetical protein
MPSVCFTNMHAVIIESANDQRMWRGHGACPGGRDQYGAVIETEARREIVGPPGLSRTFWAMPKAPCDVPNQYL